MTEYGHESFKVGDKVRIRPNAIENMHCDIGEVTALADAPEMYCVENDYHKLIIGNGHLKLVQENKKMEAK